MVVETLVQILRNPTIKESRMLKANVLSRSFGDKKPNADSIDEESVSDEIKGTLYT